VDPYRGNSLNDRDNSMNRFLAATLFIASLAGAASADAGFLGLTRDRPAESEFGMGPRISAKQLYTARLEPRQPIRLRTLQTVGIAIADANGQPVEGATIAIDGGMPEHMHGLPTQPRVTRMSSPGVYEIEGVRFSMAGWWELKLAIESPAGKDSVTFNLGL
jgi:hypothetical protein